MIRRLAPILCYAMVLFCTLAAPLRGADRIVMATQNVNYKEGLEELARQYMELHPEIEVEMIFITLNYETWVRTQFAGGEDLAPDIYNGFVTNTFGRQGKWVDLTPYLKQENPYTSQPWNETLEMNLVEKAKEIGQYFHIPLDYIEIGVFYNKTLFEKNGYSVPETWEEMMALGEEIQADGLVPFAVPGVLREIWSGQVGWIARMLGDVYYRDLLPEVMPREGDWDYDPEREGRFVQDLSDPYDDMLVGVNQERLHRAILDGTIDFTGPRTRRVYERMKEWSQYWQEGFLGSDGSVTHRLFLTQQAVMEMHHSGNVVWMMKELADLPPEKRFDWGVFAIPPIVEDPLAVGPMRGIGGIGSALTVTKKSDPQHEQNVIDFLMFLTAPENTQLIFDTALRERRPITGPPAVVGVELDPAIGNRFKPFGGRGYEKLNFRGLDDEQESVYEWSVLLQDYLGDRIELDDMLKEYQRVILRAHERIRERNHLDMDPATNDMELYRQRMAELNEQPTGPSLINGTVITGAFFVLFGGLLLGLTFMAPPGMQRRRAITAYTLLLPSFILVLTFAYYPAFAGLLAGFTKWEEGQEQTFSGLSNFIEMTRDPILVTSIINQLVLLITGLLKATIVPLAIAELVIYLRSKRLQYVFRTGFLLPLVVPAMVALLIWGFVYDPQTGLLNSFLDLIGLEEWKSAWLGEPRLALPSIVFLGFPWVGAFGFLIYLAGLMNISSSVMDASRMECRSTWQRILFVDIPMLRGQTRLLVILTMIGSLQEFQTVLILTSGGPGTSTMIPALRMFFSAFRFNHFGYASAIGFSLFVAILVLTYLNYRYLKTEETQ